MTHYKHDGALYYEHDGILYVQKERLADAVKHKELSRKVLGDFIEAGLIAAIKEEA